MVVIYTADIQRSQVKTDYDIGGIKIHIEPAFLSELDSEGIRKKIASKIYSGEALTDEDMMEFIVLPLSYPTKEKKQEVLRESIHLAIKIEDTAVSSFVLSGLVVFGDKVIDVETRNKVKEILTMTQIGRMFWEEKEREKEEVRREVTEQVTRQVTRQVTEQVTREVRQEDEEKAANSLAQVIVNAVNHLATYNHLTVGEACQQVGFSLMDYTNANLRLERMAAANTVQ